MIPSQYNINPRTINPIAKWKNEDAESMNYASKQISKLSLSRYTI